MAKIIEMPRLSDTMTEGVIAAWHKKVGDPVSAGELLAEIETDKATMDLESFHSGVLLYAGVEAGKGIPVGGLLAVVGQAGEDISAILSQYAAGAPAAVPAEQPAAKPEPQPVAPPVAQPAAPVLPSAPAPVPQVSVAVPADGDGRLKASPLAKAIARDRGIDLSLVAGSGDSGRIVKRDIENFQAPAVPVHQPAAQPAYAGTGEAYEEVPVSQMRKVIARRLGESKFTAPHFYLTMEIDMEKAIAVRKALNETAPVKISFNDMVIKACAVALKQHPAVNASWLGDKIRYNKQVHIGMAVAVDEGLLVPVIRFADMKGLAAIAQESKAFAQKARDRKLQPADWEGNTFTISNLGMMGIEEFTAIINPPDACILAVGAIIEKPVVRNGQIVIGNTMKVTLSCDHRVVDGMVGSAFLGTLRQLLEDPVRMLI
ncbi:MAG: pyruvate dehydrogenase complex dihydrolipoamide acetyltransferase [Bacteroidia bacterium]|nr:pyruvate dehydrogenase complex dihydrolipoamide acetyltransferase [Bacteroidia bacterium]